MDKIYSYSTKDFEYFVTLDGPIDQYLQVKQVHGNIVLNEKDIEKNSLSEADGITLHKKSTQSACIKTADCLPIVLIGLNNHSIIHAGWRGLFNKILKNDSLLKNNISTVIIGPHIRKCCFEVTSDFQTWFGTKNFIKSNNKLYFDLTQEAKDQINLYYPDALIIDSLLCTGCNEQLHSFRRDKTDKRNLNILTNRLGANE